MRFEAEDLERPTERLALVGSGYRSLCRLAVSAAISACFFGCHDDDPGR